MSAKKKINDDMIFQSFSKNFVFESNKDNNKTSKIEIIDFSFKKNLFSQKTDENANISNTNNYISSLNFHDPNIYSKNDKNIQESGHFGKSKYESKNYKEIMEKNAMKRQPVFHIEEKFNREKEEEEEKKAKNIANTKKNMSSSSPFNDKIKKIQIIRKKKSIKNNKSINAKRTKKLIDESIFNINNNKTKDEHEQSYLYKKKFFNNNINLSNISNISNYSNERDTSYENSKIKNTFYRINNTINTINVNEIDRYTKYNKYELSNIYRNNNQYKKLIDNNTNRNKLKINSNSNYILRSAKENKENCSFNCSNNYNNFIFHNQNINNIVINNNQFCPNLGNIKYINVEPEKSYSKMHKENNRLSNKNTRNENTDRLSNQFKTKKIKKSNNIIQATNSLNFLIKGKNIKTNKENKTKNYNNICFNDTRVNTINNKSIGLFKTRTLQTKLDNKKGKNAQNKKILDNVNVLKERILKCCYN